MEYRTVAEARGLPGLRLVLSTGTPGPWGIAARALFTIRKVPFVPVAQEIMAANEELVAWTGRRNAPVAVYGDEPAVDGWLDIVNLAERLGTGPSLLPDDPLERVLATGFSAEICGPGGFGWSRRLAMNSGASAAPDESSPQTAMMRAYGLRADAVAAAPARVAGILRALAAQLHRQRAAGSPFLVGERLGACDVHWACFSQLVAPLSAAQCPVMPDYLRTMFAAMPEAIRAALDPVLIEHRERIWADHIGLPLDY